jgi:hypothetical protein
MGIMLPHEVQCEALQREQASSAVQAMPALRAPDDLAQALGKDLE